MRTDNSATRREPELRVNRTASELGALSCYGRLVPADIAVVYRGKSSDLSCCLR